MVNILCYKSKTLSNGENPLMIRVCKDGKKKYQSLGVSVNPKFWDFEKERPKANCPNKELILKLISEKTKVFSEHILEYKATSKDFSAKTLLYKVKSPFHTKTVKELFDIQIKRLDEAKRLRYAEMYRLVFHSLIKFNKHLDVYFSDIDVTWLRNYETWLRSNNLKENTIGIRFRTLRALYNIAIDEKIVKKDYYPFDDYKVSKLKQKTAKRAIQKDSVINILNYKGKTPYQCLAIDLFTFSYLTAGINFVDICNLKQANIIDNRLSYIRKKQRKSLQYLCKPKQWN
jgi:hypothetical protein